MEQWGVWDARIILNLEDWAGNFGIMPGGKHDNVLEFAGFDDLMAFMRRDLVLRYKWSTKLRLSDDSKRGLKWLAPTKATARSARWSGSGSASTTT